EQPDVIGLTISRYVNPAALTVRLPDGAFNFAALDRLTISACGTAFYAGLVAKYWFEKWARLPIEIDVASELRYRDTPWTDHGGALFISQSGETADTLAALREARANGQQIATVVNVAESTIAREADIIFPMAAGPEIGVASTKAFTCQLVSLACIAIAAGRARGTLDETQERELVSGLLEIPRLAAEALKESDKIEAIARDIAKATGVFFIGRGVSYPIALEGALKLKEISYIHAEGYAAGELKHGPIALIDEHLPVTVVAPMDAHFEKTVSNMQEVMARDGKALMISCKDGITKAGDKAWATIEAPKTHPMLAPIVYAIPVQLLAYFTATTKGTDVDQPRNLAKSVTVE
ncbi:MAG: glutamine--fructose-6-phosphate transaminase (isomerizing), partial [Pseudomonadota bacterium]